MLLIVMNPPDIYPTLMAPIPLLGTGLTAFTLGPNVCVEGDEMPLVLLAPQPYQSPTFYTTPGMGQVKVTITSSNKAAKTTHSGKKILIKGQVFTIEFNVTVPAIYVNEASGVPTPDSVMKKTGTGQFITTNPTVKAG